MLIYLNNKTFDVDDLLTEKIVVTKRKYTDLHPAHKHSTYAPVRKKILTHIQNNGGKINKTDLSNVGIGKGWLNKNKHLLIPKIKNQNVVYHMTDRSKRLLTKMKEQDNNIYNKDFSLNYNLDDYLSPYLFENDIK